MMMSSSDMSDGDFMTSSCMAGETWNIDMVSSVILHKTVLAYLGGVANHNL